jgi:hypothetical protein
MMEIGVIFLLIVFGTGWLSTYLSHLQKMTELKVYSNIVLEEQKGANSEVRIELTELRTEVSQLREEIRQLRDTAPTSDPSLETETDPSQEE